MLPFHIREESLRQSGGVVIKNSINEHKISVLQFKKLQLRKYIVIREFSSTYFVRGHFQSNTEWNFSIDVAVF